jgi:hypothetical protein
VARVGFRSQGEAFTLLVFEGEVRSGNGPALASA